MIFTVVPVHQITVITITVIWWEHELNEIKHKKMLEKLKYGLYEMYLERHLLKGFYNILKTSFIMA